MTSLVGISYECDGGGVRVAAQQRVFSFLRWLHPASSNGVLPSTFAKVAPRTSPSTLRCASCSRKVVLDRGPTLHSVLPCAPLRGHPLFDGLCDGHIMAMSPPDCSASIAAAGTPPSRRSPHLDNRWPPCRQTQGRRKVCRR